MADDDGTARFDRIALEMIPVRMCRYLGHRQEERHDTVGYLRDVFRWLWGHIVVLSANLFSCNSALTLLGYCTKTALKLLLFVWKSWAVFLFIETAQRVHWNCTWFALILPWNCSWIVTDTALRKPGNCSKTALKWFLNCSWTTLKLHWRGSRITLKLIWNCSIIALYNCTKATLELLWNCTEITMKLQWNCTGIALELPWNCPKTALKLP